MPRAKGSFRAVNALAAACLLACATFAQQAVKSPALKKMSTPSPPAQVTAFNFQGRLNDGTSPANGTYDLEFRLYDAINGGAQIGATLSRPNVTLINGLFSTQLDFGAAAFDGGDRFIEIGARRAAGAGEVPNAFVVLGPRQQILTAPYAVRSLRATGADNTDNLGGINAGGFIQNPTPNASPQPANISITGDGFFGGGGVFRGGIAVSGTSSEPDPLHANFIVAGRLRGGESIESDAAVIVNGGIKVLGSSLPDNQGNSYTGKFYGNVDATGNVSVGGNINAGGNVSLSGNLSQPLTAYGVPKAMALVEENTSTGNYIITRCYNSTLTGSAAITPPCGFTLNHFTAGGYGLDFGFDVTNSFVSLAGGIFGQANGGLYYQRKGGRAPTTIDIRTYYAGETTETSNILEFTIILY